MAQLTIKESDKYYFDAIAAERPIKFCKYVRHFEDKWYGQVFTPTDEQAHHIRQIYGWKHRATGIRKHRHVFFECAKGWGKTPLMSLLGLYEMFASGQKGAYVVSLATVYKQAKLTFDFAVAAIKQDKKLEQLSEVTKHEVRVPDANNKWEVLSGTFDGRSGFRPSLILADELMEHPNGNLLKNVTINMPKRAEPLLIMCTNSGSDKNCFAWEIHEIAERVLAGDSEREDFYPVIHAAPKEMDWTSEAAAKAANPSLGQIGTFDALLPEIAAAKESSAAEAKYRRLYLSQWHQGGAEKWLDLNDWDACTRPFKRSEVADFPLYLGLDLSEVDDLSSLVWVWVGKGTIYVKSHQWLPRKTANKYEDSDGTPYSKWAADGEITLLDSDTIDQHALERIAKVIRRQPDRYKLKVLAYDRKRANLVVKLAEKKGITCVGVGQKAVDISPGVDELERLLKARNIVIYPGECMRSHAGEVEVAADQAGNRRLVKANAKGRYAGTKGSKHDSISALVTALVEVHRDGIAAAGPKAEGPQAFYLD